MRLPGASSGGWESSEPFDLNAPSFSALLRRAALEGDGDLGAPLVTNQGSASELSHLDGTTVLAVAFGEGVVMAGDRQATAGNTISKRDMRKIFEADAWSAVAISGAAGPAMELAKVFATELEHYEKVEGSPLSLDGKANKLAQMVRAHLPMAMQGLVVVPLFGGYDPWQRRGAIFEFDPAGGHYEERHFATSGSGGRDARGSLKARYREDLDEGGAVSVALEALWDAADEDAATGGPDLVRQIYPLVAVVDSEGYRELDEEVIRERVENVISTRRGA